MPASRVPAMVIGHLRETEFLDKFSTSQTKTKIIQLKSSLFNIFSQRLLVSTFPDSPLGSMFLLLSSAVVFGHRRWFSDSKLKLQSMPRNRFF